MIRHFLFFLVAFVQTGLLQAQVPTPKEHFGFNIGDDYQLANYTQTEAYFKKLAAASDRVQLEDMGPTEEGRHQYMLIVSSPENIKNLQKYKAISQRLARAEGLTDAEAHQLAREGKAIVWIDGGLHATETVGAHQLIETAYQFASRNDEETQRLLNDAIILFVHANPDGQELVANWYMQEKDPKKRNMNIPRLYNKYIGHDNNRDFMLMNIKETQNIARQQYLEWMPQIIYNHHQSGPAGSVVAGPPYRDPFNYRYDPLLVTSIDAVGAAMNNRLNVEGKPGFTQRYGSSFSTWWNGGLRTTAYFHNMVGLLTEIIGNPTPASVPLVPSRLIPNGATPNPITPQEWHFRQSIDYSVALNYAVLNYAVNQKEDLLFNIYKMGKNSIEKGSHDNWSLTPRYIDSVDKLVKKNQSNRNNNARGAQQDNAKYFEQVFKDPSLRDPRGYIIPADQADFPTAVRFVNALVQSGLLVQKATAPFKVNRKQYPAGSYVVKTAQAFRPYVLDMFEPQDHPNDFAYPGGPPVRPYDAAGWTIAYSMGVDFDRFLEDFNGPFERVPYGEWQNVKTTIADGGSGYLINAQVNNAFEAVNDLMKNGVDVYRTTAAQNGLPAGSFYIPASAKAKEILQKDADLGLSVLSAKQKPTSVKQIKPARIALWDNYGGSMSSGWVRWLMEQNHFPFQVIYPSDIDAGNLNSKYDVIVFVPGAIPPPDRQPRRFNNTQNVPAEYKHMTGNISADTSIPQIKKFLENGGKVVAMGSSTALAYHLDLPVKNALVELDENNEEKPLAAEKYYIPGSILRMDVDNMQPAAWGMNKETDIYFSNSPVFKLTPEAIVSGSVKPIGWFSSEAPMRSGWAWGQAYLMDGITSFVANTGKGKLYAFGPEVTFRGQTHGTFKLLFNQLYKMD
ncbi:MAG: M14 family metallopeptidase [Flavisolibacter sp.]